MTRDIINKIRSNPKHLKFLREHSYLYKELNRNNNLNLFEKEYKNYKKNETINKIEDLKSSVDIISKIIGTIN